MYCPNCGSQDLTSDPKCPNAVELVHCRNCGGTYSVIPVRHGKDIQKESAVFAKELSEKYAKLRRKD